MLKNIITICALLLVLSCDDGKMSKSDEINLLVRIKLEYDSCQPPDEMCNGTIIQACRTGVPFNFYEDTVDCAATGQVCSMSTRNAECE
jgi:hypothetical protein